VRAFLSGRSSGVSVFGLALLVVVFLVPTATAFAAASEASCMGFEASAVSPPGSSDEIPDGMPGLKAFVDEAFPNLPPGAVYSSIARLRLGSHEACDEALE
jgi:hypothetical protein